MDSTPTTWPEIIAVEPRLAELSYAIARHAVPTAEPGYGELWTTILDVLEQLARPLGDEAFGVARDRLHRVYTDAALRESMLRDQEAVA